MNRKYTVSALLLSLLVFASCQKENGFQSFTGVIANSLTKTAIYQTTTDDAGEVWTSVKWRSGDKVRVFSFEDGSQKGDYTATPNTVPTSATFSGTSFEADHYLAVYPQTSNLAFSASTKKLTKLTVPIAQTASANSYYPSSAIMTGFAASTDNIIEFKNFCALISVKPLFDCQEILITSDGAPLATNSETLTLTLNDDGSVSTFSVPAASASPTVKLQPSSSGGKIAANKTYYIAVLPGTYALTFSFVAAQSDAAGDMIFLKKKAQQITLNSSELLEVGSFSIDGWVSPSGTTEFWTESVGMHYQVYEGHEYADLGLPSGALWATHNIGATEVWDKGDYFAFGETEVHYTSLTFDASGYGTAVFKKIVDPYTGDSVNWSYSFRYYPYFDTVPRNPVTTNASYCLYKAAYTGTNFPFDSVHHDVPLPHQYDAAYANWGGAVSEHGGRAAWRMPTYAEVKELQENTIQMWTNNFNGSGQKGFIFFSSESNSLIFFPATSLFTHGSMPQKNYVESYYWTASYRVDGESLYGNENPRTHKKGCGTGCMMKFADGATVKYSNEWVMNGRCVRPMVKVDEVPSSK